jgi:hypothetical protein
MGGRITHCARFVLLDATPGFRHLRRVCRHPSNNSSGIVTEEC